ncbi:TRAP transporter large permease [Shewanella gelidii]|uniref:TRAP transporter large permease protein n=1 Tax=Shewanella gelidii TaxID=1642821 RepID=A0A917N984_9GAMM|nr:TRAP transporter large permease subunit [Shewanella gelidii]MCL1097279.1 TRAP transporter large permease subunit [Shewanella gelidii]GGI73869.1 C4-dicarboxylate ABC transporter [Shewanella gelidii]
MEFSEILVIAMFVTFIAFLFTGIPIAYVLGGVGVIFGAVGYFSDEYLGTMSGLDLNALGIVVSRIFSLMENWVLVALPMFIFMGLMLDKSGVAERMMMAMQELFGRVRGGLGITVTLIGIILAASTGIIGASVVLLGLLSIPAMMKQNYSKTFATGIVCSAGCLGILIPPSIMLVIMADQLALSVGDLFTAAVFPGLLLGFVYLIYILGLSWFKPDVAPLAQDRRPLTFTVIWEVIRAILPPIILIVAVLGSIFGGVATPTEASGVGALGATLLALYNRKLNRKVFHEVLMSSYKTTAYIFSIFIGATLFSLVLRELGGDEFISAALTGLPFGDYGVLIVILVIVFLLGFLLDWIEITLIVLPLLAPVIGELNFDLGTGTGLEQPVLVWFVMLIAVTLQTSFLTPPVGFALFYLKGVCPPEIKLTDIYKGVVPFIMLQLLGLGLLVAYPELALWLPNQIYGK